ncbi:MULTISPECIES: ATP-dependent DNA helicase [unclassified Hydrogenobaculum]|uniref:ATP-dependent DNA helicase n=1 Tax=unclassified Hydrogenobaculum TaxID=2622382 RepID=UPI0001C5074B|nr:MULTISPECIES: ATP-dependent DNA helicase [unclassified Hydrogenobaculum]AEF18854.1 DEAD_2 domain protein [Hydrogenobaculum sp. 3684]AEG46142.1 helicase c2 [Hydrogenobaculum sp. SHO]AGG14787.1 helicase c2 [Hydrogenobaculum sp. HO]
MELYKTLLNLGYERRKSQEKMFSIVEECINKEDFDDEEQNVVLIEAPTGVGKSFGYLLPIIEHGKQAIISTKTKILQEQLRRDLEHLSSIRKNYFGKGINYLILKGKANYLCLDRFYDKENELKQTTIFGKVSLANTIRELIESSGWDGDVEFTSIPLEVWTDINIDENYCDSNYRKSCPYLKDCFYYKKLKDKEKLADILVVNHSLLVLKNFDDTKEKILVIDEAHELDEALVKSLTSGFSVIGLMRLAASIRDMLDNDNKNMLDNVDILSIFKSLFEGIFESKKQKPTNKPTIGKAPSSIPLDEPFFVEPLISMVYEPLNQAVNVIKNYVINTVKERLEYKNTISRKFKAFLESSLLFENEFLNRFSIDTSELQEDFEDKSADRLEHEIMRLIAKFKSISNRVSNIYNTLKYMEDEENKDIIGFVVSREFSKKLGDFNYKIEAFPIFPRDAIDLSNYKCVILTSATLDKDLIELTTGISGEYYSLEHVFNYEDVSFIIKNVVPKNKDLWKEELINSLRYLRTFYSKVLVLLTSYEQMEYIPKDEDIIFQNTTTLRKAIEMVENGDKNVLVGVDSVWTGIDLKGDKGLLMAKLPFDSPEDPINYHRMRYFKKHNKATTSHFGSMKQAMAHSSSEKCLKHTMDSFIYARKKAFLQFKQGFGRLVRSKKDKGTIIICDSRIWRYEEFINFIKSLRVKIYYRQQRGD